MRTLERGCWRVCISKSAYPRVEVARAGRWLRIYSVFESRKRETCARSRSVAVMRWNEKGHTMLTSERSHGSTKISPCVCAEATSMLDGMTPSSGSLFDYFTNELTDNTLRGDLTQASILTLD